MNLIDLEKLARNENIDIINSKIIKNKARIINYLGKHILMDYSQIHTGTEEKCLLAEELRSLLSRLLLHS